MADQKITALTQATPALTDEIPFVSSPGVTPVTKQTLVSALLGLVTTGLPAGHLFGLTLSNGTDATNDINIAIGKCRNLADTGDMALASILTKQLDAAWSVGSAAGGLDTGSIGDKTYHIWLIKRTDTGVVDALFSASASAPTMPANYDQKRRIGSIIRAAGSILAFYQIGDQFWWKGGEVTDVNGTSDTTGTLKVLTVPAGVKMEAIIDALVGAPAGGGGMNIYDPDIGTTVNLFATRSSVVGNIGARIRVFTNTSAQIRYYVTGATVAAYIYTQGWIDTRGKLE